MKISVLVDMDGMKFLENIWWKQRIIIVQIYFLTPAGNYPSLGEMLSIIENKDLEIRIFWINKSLEKSS